MALIVLPGGQQISGSIGGTVYSHNRYGAYIRSRSMPVNPNSPRQAAIRGILKTLTIRWNQTLTEAQRQSWRVYALNVPWINSLGQRVILTALSHYLRSNAPRAQAGLAVIDTAPSTFNLGDPPQTLSATASEATQKISVAFDNGEPWANENGGALLISHGAPTSEAVNFYGAPWRYCGKVLGNQTTPPTSPVVLDAAWPFAKDQRIFLKARVTRADGRLSTERTIFFRTSA